MTSTLNQIVTILAERVGKQYDLPFKRELKTIVNYWRATILRQALKENPKDSSYFYSSWQMEVQPDFIMKCPFNYGCVMRTVDPLPKSLRVGSLRSFVGTPDLETPYSYFVPDHKSFVAYNRNSKRANIHYTELDGYGYFYGMKETQKYIGVRDIVTDLDAVAKYKKCNSDAACYSDDDAYPLTEDLVQRLIQAVLGTELRVQVNTTNEEEVKVNGIGSKG